MRACRDCAFTCYPALGRGGQSGDPKNSHYDDMIDTWARDEYVSIPFHPSPDRFAPEQIERRMTLQPPLAQVESTIP